MSTNETGQIRNQKFQERLARISRRRFMRLVGAGGLTAAGAYYGWPSPEAAAAAPLVRCSNTRALFRDVKIETLFSSTLYELLKSASEKNRVPDGCEYMATRIMTSVDRTLTLVDFFADKSYAETANLKRKLQKANSNLAIPFLYLPDDRRSAVRTVLGKEGKFRKVFGEKTLDYIHENSSFDSDEVEALAEAHSIGLFRLAHWTVPLVGLRAAQAERCARRHPVTGAWDCNQIQTNSKCSLVDGEPSGDTDICPGYLRKALKP